MSIHDFHSKLSSRTENPLFEALRRLRGVTVQAFNAEDEEAALGGWYQWDGQAPPVLEPAIPEV
ncbi:MAG TPA: hypothetical protein VJ885_10695 [Thermoanaerobaculia bacterium]|nr:hypothetical protein [Thermoanaerobaculia bacterium]